MLKTLELNLEITAENKHIKPSKLLADETGLSQAKIKDAMRKGAVWLQAGKSNKRLRRAAKKLQVGAVLSLNYNSEILAQTVPEPTLIHDAGDYSIWFKPFGLSCQGSRWGDFASISRWVEMNISNLTQTAQRAVYLVHRLDRATIGLMLLCHSKQASRLFSQMFAEGKIDKRYQAIVAGDFSEQKLTVNQPIDGKNASTEFSLIQNKNDQSKLNVRLFTGRKHQIRKHLSGLGFPIIGDRLYGKAETEDIDLQLQSVSLSFKCPIKNTEQTFLLDESKRLKLL